jgi:hypothetical protein
VGQGERRIQAVTSHEARKARAEGEALFQRARDLLESATDEKLGAEYLVIKNLVDTSVIPHVLKSQIRYALGYYYFRFFIFSFFSLLYIND